jgi:hypothetical protein
MRQNEPRGRLPGGWHWPRLGGKGRPSSVEGDGGRHRGAESSLVCSWPFVAQLFFDKRAVSKTWRPLHVLEKDSRLLCLVSDINCFIPGHVLLIHLIAPITRSVTEKLHGVYLSVAPLVWHVTGAKLKILEYHFIGQLSSVRTVICGAGLRWVTSRV